MELVGPSPSISVPVRFGAAGVKKLLPDSDILRSRDICSFPFVLTSEQSYFERTRREAATLSQIRWTKGSRASRHLQFRRSGEKDKISDDAMILRYNSFTLLRFSV